jgi:hypothetical protein
MTLTEMQEHEDAQDGAAILMAMAVKFSDLSAVYAITKRLAADEVEGLPFTRKAKMALKAGRMVIREHG